jgi:hypothetical protein
MARFYCSIERIQIHLASGNGQGIGGMKAHRRTIQETLGMCGGSALPLPGGDACSYRPILHVGSTCVKWIPPLFNIMVTRAHFSCVYLVFGL